MNTKKQNKEFFYFFCLPNTDLSNSPDGNIHYQHCILSLAEGLGDLGYACYGNEHYWQTSPDSPYVIQQQDSAIASQAKAIIVSMHWLMKTHTQPNFNTQVPIFLMADMQELAHLLFKIPYLEKFTKVLYCGYIQHYTYPENFVPWAFGLTNRLIKESSHGKNPFEKRKNTIICNARMEHTSRFLAKKYLYPSLQSLFEIDISINSTPDFKNKYEKYMFAQTGSRHYPQYFKALGDSQALVAVGGYFASGISHNRFNIINRIVFKLIRTLKIPSHILVQHDSWRFWEGLCMGALTFHLDFDRCNVLYPVQPINGIHYVGVYPRFFKKHTLEDFLLSLPLDTFASIAKQGQNFVFEHYAPVPVAQRLLSLIS